MLAVRTKALLVLIAAAWAAFAFGDPSVQTSTFQVALPGPGADLGMMLVGGAHGEVSIVGVLPGSAAYDAGLEPGDQLVAINGTDLTDAAAPATFVRAFRVLKQVAPGDTVRIEYLRAGEIASVDVPARDWVAPPSEGVRTVTFVGPRMAGGPSLPPGGRGMVNGVEVVDLDTDLGHYFGVVDGVLVLHSPPDETGGGLHSGDVVRSVGDRAVSSSEEFVHAFEGRTGDVSIEVLRDGAIMTVLARGGGGGPVLIAPPPTASPSAVNQRPVITSP